MPALLRFVLWVCLGGWIGAWFLFAFGVAPVAFRLPSPELGGQVVGPVLTALHLYGGIAGLVLAGVAAALGRGRLTIALPLLLSAVCFISQFAVTAAVAEVRPQDLGPESAPDAAARFAFLHQLSMILYTVVGVGAIALAVLHARADTREG